MAKVKEKKREKKNDAHGPWPHYISSRGIRVWGKRVGGSNDSDQVPQHGVRFEALF